MLPRYFRLYSLSNEGDVFAASIPASLNIYLVHKCSQGISYDKGKCLRVHVLSVQITDWVHSEY